MKTPHSMNDLLDMLDGKFYSPYEGARVNELLNPPKYHDYISLQDDGSILIERIDNQGIIEILSYNSNKPII